MELAGVKVMVAFVTFVPGVWVVGTPLKVNVTEGVFVRAKEAELVTPVTFAATV
jgi:hypothetical protein